MAQGATHLRCSSGGEIKVAEGGKFKNQGNLHTTGAAQSTELDPWGTYALDTSGVYIINPVRGSICTIHIHSTAKLLFKATSQTYNTRFPSSNMRVVRAWASTKDAQVFGPGFQIKGFSTVRAYIVGLAGWSSDANNTHLIVSATSTT
jgi:hypothetical protein